jgi:pantetheine-phosphate adenylyltransferase
MPVTAVYAGSFDPITNGHLDLLQRAVGMYEEVVLAIGKNPNKKTLLSLEDRLDILREVTAHMPTVRIAQFDGLLVDFCRAQEAQVILRGLRAVTDFEFEFQIGLANMDMAPTVQTVFLLTDPQNIFITSSLVREIAGAGGDVTRYVPPAAHRGLMDALQTS